MHKHSHTQQPHGTAARHTDLLLGEIFGFAEVIRFGAVVALFGLLLQHLLQQLCACTHKHTHARMSAFLPPNSNMCWFLFVYEEIYAFCKVDVVCACACACACACECKCVLVKCVLFFLLASNDTSVCVGVCVHIRSAVARAAAAASSAPGALPPLLPLSVCACCLPLPE